MNTSLNVYAELGNKTIIYMRGRFTCKLNRRLTPDLFTNKVTICKYKNPLSILPFAFTIID